MKLSALWQNGMVIQREKPILLEGIAQGNKVIVCFGNKVYEKEVEEDGQCSIWLDAMSAGENYTLTIYDVEKTVISDILIGDVWILGGQSNMELPLSRIEKYEFGDVTELEERNIRQFNVSHKYLFGEKKEILEEGEWIQATKKNILQFSAAGYFFGKEVYKEEQVPIGLIHTAVGGTPVEAWMKEQSLLNWEGYQKELDILKQPDYIDDVIKQDNERIETWFQTMNEQDPGLKSPYWYENIWENQEYHEIVIPGLWYGTNLEDYKGSIWFQKNVVIPKHWCEKEIRLTLGTLIDGDDTYINGVLVGRTGYRFPPRNYRIAPGVLKEGKNTITIRLFSDAQQGGFVEDKNYELVCGEEKISLKGIWKYRMGTTMTSLNPPTFFQYKPSGLYNGMIYPMRTVQCKGIVFYQGESNTNRPKGYGELFQQMIRDWRETLREELPVIYVQLANYGDCRKNNEESNWAELRNEQAKALEVKNTAMIVAMDIGEYNDLHPQNKKEIGRRVALAAKKLVYKKECCAMGPIVKEVVCRKEEVILVFDSILFLSTDSDQLLVIDCYYGEEIKVNKVRVQGNSIVILNKEKQLPNRITYAWRNQPTGALLFNEERLPAIPFCLIWNKENRKYENK